MGAQAVEGRIRKMRTRIGASRAGMGGSEHQPIVSRGRGPMGLIFSFRCGPEGHLAKQAWFVRCFSVDGRSWETETLSESR